MDFRFNRPMRILSTVTLAFFLWTFGGIFDIAHAISNSSKFQVASSKSKGQKTGKKFENTLEDIEQVLADTVTDTDTKKEKLKTKKLEIEVYDIEIRKQFEETEKRLKDAGLPGEILQRHNDFVRKYEENFNELKANLEAIERAKGKVEVEAEVEKAKEFLKKVKPKKKHVPLDPNKLPHRTAKPTEKKPRLKKEEFGPQSTQREDSRQYGVGSKQEPILVASAGPLSGLLSSDSGLLTQNSELTTPNSQLLTQNLLLAAADPPTDSDLAETIEVQFTPAIQAKAAELGNNPVKIYNWVRNNVEFVPTYGSIQGADYCLQTLQCNAFDTASLLIALLRVSGIHARYVYGTIELPIEKVMNWVGGFTDPKAAIDFMASGGIPVTGLVSGGEIVMVRMEHVWIEAYVPYGPYSGRPSKLNPPKTWIHLDPSFKQYTYTEGMDLQSAVPFDAEGFFEQIQSTATINEAESYVTNIDSSYIQTTLTNYQTQVQDYIDQNMPNATVGDVLGKKEIIKQELSILPATLPYKGIVTGARYSAIPDNLRHKISFKLIKDIYDDFSDTFMDITKSLPELAGKKITLSYSPATQADEDVINSYIPDPGPDGTIDPSELPTSLPAYLINVKPELRIDEEVVATGTVVGMGATEESNMTFTGPNAITDRITNDVKAGEYLGIAIDLGRISGDQIIAIKAKFESTKAKLEAEDFVNLTKDDTLGDILYMVAMSYNAEMDTHDEIQAKSIGVVSIRLPSEAIFKTSLEVTTSFGMPVSVSAGGFTMDIDRNLSLVKAFDGDNDKKLQFLFVSGITLSTLEHSVSEQLFSTPDNPVEGVSAVKALQMASSQGIPVYSITKNNIDAILPQLELDLEVINDIKNAVNAGNEVTVSKTNITFGDWVGCGYVVFNPATGNGAYMISGGDSGAKLVEGIAMLIRSILPLQSSSVFDSPSEAIKLVLEGLGGIITFYADYLIDCYWPLIGDKDEFYQFAGTIADMVAAYGLIVKGSAPLMFTLSFYVAFTGGTILLWVQLFKLGMECTE